MKKINTREIDIESMYYLFEKEDPIFMKNLKIFENVIRIQFLCRRTSYKAYERSICPTNIKCNKIFKIRRYNKEKIINLILRMFTTMI